MASIMRPAIFRQAFQAVPAKTSLSTALPAFRSQVSRQAISRQVSPSATRVAAFHATQRQSILPPLPQRIEGTVNDAAKVPDPTPAHGSYHWTFERIFSAALVPLTIAPFTSGALYPVVDAIFAATILIHSHIGFESIIIDYVPYHRLPGVRKFLMWALKAATLVVGIGFYEFETNDIGLTAAISRIWHA